MSGGQSEALRAQREWDDAKERKTPDYYYEIRRQLRGAERIVEDLLFEIDERDPLCDVVRDASKAVYAAIKQAEHRAAKVTQKAEKETK